MVNVLVDNRKRYEQTSKKLEGKGRVRFPMESFLDRRWLRTPRMSESGSGSGLGAGGAGRVLDCWLTVGVVLFVFSWSLIGGLVDGSGPEETHRRSSQAMIQYRHFQIVHTT